MMSVTMMIFTRTVAICCILDIALMSREKRPGAGSLLPGRGVCCKGKAGIESNSASCSPVEYYSFWTRRLLD
jgi:hypothetical protein